MWMRQPVSDETGQARCPRVNTVIWCAPLFPSHPWAKRSAGVHTTAVHWDSPPAHSMRRGWRASSPVLAERCVPALSWLLPGMGPPVVAGCDRTSEHLVLRFSPGGPGLRAPCAETHTLPPPERPARRPAPLGIGLASLTRTPRCWWPSPRLDGRLEVCPGQRHGLGALIRPGAATRSSRPCSGPALLPDSVSPASRRDLLGTTGRGVR